MSDSDADSRADEWFREIGHRASKVAVGSFIGWSRVEVEAGPAKALAAAIEKMPKSGPIQGDKAVIVKGMMWLLSDVPQNHADRDKLAAGIGNLRKRM